MWKFNKCKCIYEYTFVISNHGAYIHVIFNILQSWILCIIFPKYSYFSFALSVCYTGIRVGASKHVVWKIIKVCILKESIFYSQVLYSASLFNNILAYYEQQVAIVSQFFELTVHRHFFVNTGIILEERVSLRSKLQNICLYR